MSSLLNPKPQTPFNSVVFFPITLNESWFPGQFLFKRKKESRRKQVWKLIAPAPQGDFPKTISLSFFFWWGQGEMTYFARKFSHSKMAFETKDYGKVEGKAQSDWG